MICHTDFVIRSLKKNWFFLHECTFISLVYKWRSQEGKTKKKKQTQKQKQKTKNKN